MPGSKSLERLIPFALAVGALITPLQLRAQDAPEPEFIRLSEPPDIIEGEVTFLEKAPEIDGSLDEHLEVLPERTFSEVWVTVPGSPVVPVTYRLAYGTEFFYVYIEAEADKLTFRDRAYQNGDGFHMILAIPKLDNAPTDEFYVLACSAVNKHTQEWTRRIFWYYNVDDIFIRTSNDTKMEFREGDGKISFELILPWKDVHPYHPWISNAIGFNLCFVKAIDNGGRNRYIVLPDPKIRSENSNRLYARLKFQRPELKGDPQTFVMLKRRNISQGDTLFAVAATVSSASFQENITATIKPSEGTSHEPVNSAYTCAGGTTLNEFALESYDLSPGEYEVEWRSSVTECRGKSDLSILLPFDLADLKRRIDEVKKNVSAGSYTTLQFVAQEIDEELASVKPYETCASTSRRLARLLDDIHDAKNGEDVYAKRTGFVRRAFQSSLDNTLQPYCVWRPKKFDPKKKYPLMVFLHGSASDETNIADFSFLMGGKCIGLGPYGRGPSNAFSVDNAQEDIAEAIDAVTENYPIDNSNIFLSGFSMGGYGVYRTFYETPEKYKALVVLSGHPNMANKWLPDGNHPNFFEDKYLEPFKDVPMFIFHGKKDRNCYFSQTEKLVEKLKTAGADVQFEVDDNKGHEQPGNMIKFKYGRWLKKMLKK